MLGIDAPEMPIFGKQGKLKFPRQPFSNGAMAYLKHRVEGKQVKVEIYRRDRYKRLLSVIFLDGKDINLAMIDAGLAEVYRGSESGNPYKQQYQAAEDAALSASKGMWILGDTYESPRPTAAASALPSNRHTAATISQYLPLSIDILTPRIPVI